MFEKKELKESTEETFKVNLESFEGPLDLLLALGRTQKLDLMHISIFELVEQYIDFMENMRSQKITVAADYLVMAAWLTFLKSRLLLPPDDQISEEPSGQEMASYLAFQLERLNAMREAGERLMARNQLGVDFFARGMIEKINHEQIIGYKGTLLELLQAYMRVRTHDSFVPYVANRVKTLSLEEAFENLAKKIAIEIPEWKMLWDYLPKEWRDDPFMLRSGVASTFTVSLELAKCGILTLRQKENFAPLEVKKCAQTSQK